MRSMLSSGIAVQPIVVSSISFSRWPLRSTSVFWSPVMPKPRKSICESGPPVLSRVTMPASCDSSCGRDLVALSAICFAVMTVIPMGASRRCSGKRVAVTTTSSC